jgi:cytochrome c oxidase subunit 4
MIWIYLFPLDVPDQFLGSPMAAHSYSHAKKTYSAVLAALLVLTVITVLAAGVHFGSPSVNVIVALVIASVKASLVALFFMHLRYDKPLNAVIFCTGLVFLALFLIFCYIDVESREVSIPSTLKVSAPEKK